MCEVNLLEYFLMLMYRYKRMSLAMMISRKDIVNATVPMMKMKESCAWETTFSLDNRGLKSSKLGASF